MPTRKELEKLLEELLKLEHQETATVELDQQSIGRVSRIDALARQQIAKATEANVKLTIQELKRAIRKFDEGTYGECEECGELISEARLRARPEARLCINCKGARESG